MAERLSANEKTHNDLDKLFLNVQAGANHVKEKPWELNREIVSQAGYRYPMVTTIEDGKTKLVFDYGADTKVFEIERESRPGSVITERAALTRKGEILDFSYMVFASYADTHGGKPVLVKKVENTAMAANDIRTMAERVLRQQVVRK